MSLKRRVIALCLITACAGDREVASTDTPAASTAGAQSGDAQLADITSYRLTMPKVDAWLTAQRNIAAEMARMSPAEREAMEERSSLEDADADLDAIARNIESIPPMSRAVREAGLSAREYAVITLAMMQAQMATSVLQMRPNDNQDSLAREMQVNPANIRFVRENEAELKRRTDAMAATVKEIESTAGRR